ncbi:PIN domain-containing protein, partial [Vibrio cholerae]|uniref:PIN domain-containing protein n=1 Tax=Vibrio cholerae TaxID=666 RepID=UPI002016492B
QKIADFTGAERSGATASVIGNYIYLFGGSGKAEPSDPSPILLDTNILLHEPLAIYSFKEHDVVIPMTVLEELDR